MKRNKKIDLFFNGDYLTSTRQAKTCREAVKNYLDRINFYNEIYLTLTDKVIKKNPKGLKAFFDKEFKNEN